MDSASGIKILYIEDNPANYRLVHRLLSQAGFEMYWAEEGTAGFEMATQIGPDLILMDINLPGLSGYELTSKFRNQPELKDTPIIAITAKTQKADRETALVAGCSGYIPKPIDPFNFVSQVKAYLGGHHERLDRGSEGRALRQYNVHILEHLEAQLQEAQAANLKLMETQQALEGTNKSLARLISLGQDLLKEHDPWLLLSRVLSALFNEVVFDSFVIYLQHTSGSYWEGLRLVESELTQAPVLVSDHPFIQKLQGLESRDTWIQGSKLLAMPIWTEGYQLDVWQNNGQPCLFLNVNRQNRQYVRGFWAFDRNNSNPFTRREFEMVRLYGRLAHVCLENAEMILEMTEKSAALSVSYESLERTHHDLQRVKTELQEKDRHALLQDLLIKIAVHLKEPVAALEQNCNIVLGSVPTDDSPVRAALQGISQFTTQVRGLFHSLLRRALPETANLPEWIDLGCFIADEIAFMEVEGLLKPQQVQMEINLFGVRVYGIYSDFARLLRTMVINSISATESQPTPIQLFAVREDSIVCLEITDCAGQIHQQAIENAFEPFQGKREPVPGVRTPHPALPSCKQILATYSGNIELKNTDDGVALKATIGLGL